VGSYRKDGTCLAVLGTGSDVGKSVVVTALCRIFNDRGVDVVPFKAQNLSNNSFVTIDGGEMGRAQVVQARAARVEPHVDMNPVLLKPCMDTGPQVVVHGKPMVADGGVEPAVLLGKARESLERLRQRHHLILIEGAGSCAEINLRARDYANFRMAHVADAPVLLVADIERGGVFAQIIGTLSLLAKKDRRRVCGLIVNRFRGDATFFRDGITYLEQQTGLPVLGLVPFLDELAIDFEDCVSLDTIVDPAEDIRSDRIHIAVLRLPHISNATDFEPLARESCVRLHYLARLRDLNGYDLVILPGSKNVRHDLAWLRTTGWAQRLQVYVDGGGVLCGICGGYQTLGHVIRDPSGIEGTAGDSAGLGLLDVETTLCRTKTLTRTSGLWMEDGIAVQGYEIHMGVTTRGATVLPTVEVTSRNGEATHDHDGARSSDGKIWGTYLHGLFDASAFRRAMLARLRPDLIRAPIDARARRGDQALVSFHDHQYDLLAEHFGHHLDVDRIAQMIGINGLR